MTETAVTTYGPSSPTVRQAISDASRRTGVRFDYLFDQARRESGFQADARAATSSASGLYQFIDQTWLRLVHEHGHRHGLANDARRIDFDGNRFTIADQGQRQRILDLRFDARINAVMAGEYARENFDAISRSLDRPVNKADLALAHFLGGDGAQKFLAEHDRAPGQGAADLFPQAAAANRPVFYAHGGRQKSLDEVYRFFADRAEANGHQGRLPPTPGKGHFLSAVPAGTTGSLLSAPMVPEGSSLWRVLTVPMEN
ncbi:MAG: lytic transglycosylase domain-containing protein [Pseudomonadota bacterium]